MYTIFLDISNSLTNILFFSFLGKRGVKEEIQAFDAHKITPDIRKSVEELLKKNKDSFEAKVNIRFI